MQTSNLSKPAFTLSFENGETIEIFNWNYTRRSLIERNDRTSRFGPNGSTGTGSDWGNLKHWGRGSKWLKSEYSTDDLALVLVCRAYDSYGDLLLGDAAYSDSGWTAKAVNYEKYRSGSDRVFDRLDHSSLVTPNWELQFQLSNGEWVPFRGPLVACDYDGRGFLSAPFFPASKSLPIRGKMGESFSPEITIDTTALVRLPKPTVTKIHHLHEIQNLGDFSIIPRRVVATKNNYISCTWDIQSNTPDQTEKSWRTKRLRIGDDLGNIGGQYNYLDIPEAKLIHLAFEVETTNSFRWQRSDIEMVASGAIPANYSIATEIPLTVLPGSIADTDAINIKKFTLKKTSIATEHSLPVWEVEMEVSSRSIATLNALQDRDYLWVAFIDGQDLSHGETNTSYSSSSSSIIIVNNHNWSWEWHGELEPGTKFTFGRVKGPRNFKASYWLPKEVIERN